MKFVFAVLLFMNEKDDITAVEMGGFFSPVCIP